MHRIIGWARLAPQDTIVTSAYELPVKPLICYPYLVGIGSGDECLLNVILHNNLSGLYD